VANDEISEDQLDLAEKMIEEARQKSAEEAKMAARHQDVELKRNR